MSNTTNPTIKATSRITEDALQPPTLPLRLSVHPHDGCLLTAPLSTVLNTATETLYRDIQDMTHGTVNIAMPSSSSTTTTSTSPAIATSSSSKSTPSTIASATSSSSSRDWMKMKYSVHTGPMSSLSYTQRHFVLMSQLIHHARSISHVSGLVSAYLPFSSCSKKDTLFLLQQNQHHQQHTHHALQPQEGELSHIVTALTNRTLHQVQTSWTQADIAQDMLFFKHADLYKYRKQVHDIFGSLDVLISGSWIGGMSWDVALVPSISLSSRRINRLGFDHEQTQEEEEEEDVYVDDDEHGLEHVKYRLQRAVQSKLILGEVGFVSMDSNKLPWNITLEQDGCVVKLTYGSPFTTSSGCNDDPTKVSSYCISSSSSCKAKDALGSCSDKTVRYATNGYRTLESLSSSSSKDTKVIYPLVAYLTVLSEQAPNASLAIQEDEEELQYDATSVNMNNHNKGRSSSSSTSSSSLIAPWTLLSIQVNHQPKMGDSTFQLLPTNRQLFDLHRICVRTMAMEETRTWMSSKESTSVTSSSDLPPIGVNRTSLARPLDRLFDILYSFSLGLQMEILSAQALDLKRGTWNQCILVEKLIFHDVESPLSRDDVGGYSNREEEKKDVTEDMSRIEYIESTTELSILPKTTLLKNPLATLIIHFWDVDNRYGYPTLGTIHLHTTSDASDTGLSSVAKSVIQIGKETTNAKSLTIIIQAVQRSGIQVSISGGNQIMNILRDPTQVSSFTHAYLKKHVSQLLASVCNPFQLSMSDAILAATTISAQMRCAAIAKAFYRKRLSTSSRSLPCWIHLQSIESGSLAVAAEISYHGDVSSTSGSDSTSSIVTDSLEPFHGTRDPVILFHLTCECRTGRFITTFPQSFNLLRRLACNDVTASETQTLRQSIANMQRMNSSMVKRKQANLGIDKDLTGRFIRDAFETLNRSMDVLGRRTGVGEEWEDLDDMSHALRTKYIDQACDDIKPSLMLCCALASTYGVGCVAMGISTGVDPLPDV